MLKVPNISHVMASIRQKIKKYPLASITIGLVAVLVIGSGAYALVNTLSEQQRQANVEATADKKSVEKFEKQAEAKTEVVAENAPKEEKQVDSQATPQKNSAPAKPKADEPATVRPDGVMSKPGCYAGCATPNPSFSILTPSAVTVTVGTTAGPFTASTSNGAAVVWSTPTSNSAGAPYGFSNSNVAGPPQASPSSQYFIRAESTIAPGAYVLSMSALHASTATKVSASITVTVVPPAGYQM